MRKQAITGFIVVILWLMLAAVPASAAMDNYVVLKGGYLSPTGGGFQNLDLNGNTYWEIASGSDGKFFGAEFGVGYLQTNNSKVDVYAIPVLLSGKLRIPIALFVPYLKAGGGAYFFNGSSKTGQGSDSTVAWGYQAGGGIDFQLGPLILGIEAKYIAVNASLNMGSVKVEGVITTGNIGLRF